MNATEARKISKKNIPKLVEKSFLRSVSLINNSIKESSKLGEFEITQYLVFHESIQAEIIKRLVEHFQKQGYKVDTYDKDIGQIVLVSWE